MNLNFANKQIGFAGEKGEPDEIILSIETTAGSSLSLIRRRTEIGWWQGTAEISRAEELLDQTERLLEASNIKKEQISLIVVSKPEGSLTGGKIGVATARGLAKALNCRWQEVSVFESLLSEIRVAGGGKIVTAVPAGKKQIQWRCFIKQNTFFTTVTPTVQRSDAADFSARITEMDCRQTILSIELEEFYQSYFNPNNSTDVGMETDQIIILSRRHTAQLQAESFTSNVSN